MYRAALLIVACGLIVYYFRKPDIQPTQEMAKIFITGSSDGIGLAAAKVLSEQGHRVTLHARNADRAIQAKKACPKAEGVLIGDFASIEDTKQLAHQANEHGPWDTVVHNAAVGPSAPDNTTVDGISATFQVNTLGPYILTALMHRPKRLLYLSSGGQSQGDDSLGDVTWKERRFNAFQAYCDTKLQDIMLANAVARHWPEVQSCSLAPGWVRTKMVNYAAPGSTSRPAKAIADFATGKSDITGNRTGVYFDPSGAKTPRTGGTSQSKQDELVRICEQLSGVPFPK